MNEWAEDHGYVQGKCPECGRKMSSDTNYFECWYCGWQQPHNDEDDGQPSDQQEQSDFAHDDDPRDHAIPGEPDD